MACCGDVPTLETLAAVSILREHLPELKIRVVNVVDLMKLQPKTEHPHGLSDQDFDDLFTTNKPVIFAFHAYPWLIHRLTYRRHNHHNLHVRGYKEEGTITTPFDMTVLNELDRFHLVMDTVERVPQTGREGHLPQAAAYRTSSSSTSSTSTSTARTCPRSATGRGKCQPPAPRPSSNRPTTPSSTAPLSRQAKTATCYERMISKLPRWVLAGGWALAFVAGIINVVGLLGFEHQAVTHLTGTTSMLAAALASNDFSAAGHFAAIIGSFLAGTVLSGFLIQDSTLQLGRRYGVALLLESALLCVSVPLLEHQSICGVYSAACACGLQNAMVSTYSGAAVRTTHISGMFTDLGIFFGHALRGLPVDARRLRLCYLIISGFLCGGVAGAVAFRHLGYATLFIPGGLTAATALTYGVLRDAQTRRLLTSDDPLLVTANRTPTRRLGEGVRPSPGNEPGRVWLGFHLIASRKIRADRDRWRKGPSTGLRRLHSNPQAQPSPETP